MLILQPLHNSHSTFNYSKQQSEALTILTCYTDWLIWLDDPTVWTYTISLWCCSFHFETYSLFWWIWKFQISCDHIRKWSYEWQNQLNHTLFTRLQDTSFCSLSENHSKRYLWKILKWICFYFMNDWHTTKLSKNIKVW